MGLGRGELRGWGRERDSGKGLNLHHVFDLDDLARQEELFHENASRDDNDQGDDDDDGDHVDDDDDGWLC